MLLKNIKDEKIYKDAYITVFDKFDEEIRSYDSIDELNKEWKDCSESTCYDIKDFNLLFGEKE